MKKFKLIPLLALLAVGSVACGEISRPGRLSYYLDSSSHPTAGVFAGQFGAESCFLFPDDIYETHNYYCDSTDSILNLTTEFAGFPAYKPARGDDLNVSRINIGGKIGFVIKLLPKS